MVSCAEDVCVWEVSSAKGAAIGTTVAPIAMEVASTTLVNFFTGWLFWVTNGSLLYSCNNVPRIHSVVRIPFFFNMNPYKFIV